MMVPSLYYLRLIFSADPSPRGRLIYGATVCFSLAGLHLLSLILISYQVIFLGYNNRLRLPHTIKILFQTCIVIILFSICWVIYMQLMMHIYPQMQMGVIETAKKLYNYPKIFEKILKPVVIYGITYEFALSFLALAFIIIYGSPEKKGDKELNVILAILLLGFSGVGIAKTYYSHIRYIYFLYPFGLFFFSLLTISLWKYTKNSKLVVMTLFFLIFGSYLCFQIVTSWDKVVNAGPGSEEKFSYSRTYLDYKTCGNFLAKNRSDSDYVIALASAHQSAVYSGTINACFRPKLKEHRGRDFHYITGSKFFDTRKDLITILNEQVRKDGELWIIMNKNYFTNNSWEYNIIQKLEGCVACKGKDNLTNLARISAPNFLSLLNDENI